MASQTSSQAKTHMSVAIVGHVDAGKSSCTGRLLFELGSISDREMDKLTKEAEACGKSSFKYAFYTDNSKEERERGITINATVKEFFTDNYHYTILDCPGHRDFMKNMISGSSQADIGVLIVPADGNFATSLAKGDKKAGEVKGQSREHARILNLLGCKQLVVCINKMDEQSAGYRKERYDEIKSEIVNTLTRVGWGAKNKLQTLPPAEWVEKNIPIIPISAWQGDNLFKHSDKMSWWQGSQVTAIDGSLVTVKTMLDALNNFAKPPVRNVDKPLRVPLGGIHNIKGVGVVVTGKVEQGTAKVGQEVLFLPTHTDSKPCVGKIFSIEMHHKQVDQGECGYNVGMCIKGLDKDYLPKIGDVMILKSDTSLKTPKRIVVECQILDHPGELKPGYCPSIHCRTAKAPCKLTEIRWKVGKETGGKKMENPPFVKANEVACLVFDINPNHPIVFEKFDSCEVLARVAVMDGNEATMLGKVVDIVY